MTTEESIPDTTENWESGKLGQSEEHAQVAPDQTKAINEALGLYQINNLNISKEKVEALIQAYRRELPESKATDTVALHAMIRMLIDKYFNKNEVE